MADNDHQLSRINAHLNQPAPQPPEDVQVLLVMASYYLAENRRYVEQLQTVQAGNLEILRRIELLSRDGEDVLRLRRVQEGLCQLVATAEDVLRANQSNIQRVRRLQDGGEPSAGVGS